MWLSLSLLLIRCGIRLVHRPVTEFQLRVEENEKEEEEEKKRTSEVVCDSE